jgi:Protein of unknown function (DUF5818)
MHFKGIPRLLATVMLLAFYAFAKDPAVVTLQGEVMDSQCAYNVHSIGHSHDAMIKKGVYGRDARSCTQRCVKDMGGVFVLVVKDEVYRLDDQTQAEHFSGKKVKISGTLDTKTQTLRVLKMEADR